jgi:polyhydroxyalkanoate synthesis regulator protein
MVNLETNFEAVEKPLPVSGSGVVNLVRYGNRKIYNPGEHKYVNLKAIRAFVLSDVPFTVVEHVTNKDVTDLVLIQALTAHLTERGLDNGYAREKVKTLIKWA